MYIRSEPADYSLGLNVKNRSSNHIATFLIVVYLFSLIVRPQDRFLFLSAIHFEKVLVVLIAGVLVFTRKIAFKGRGITKLVLLFYLGALLSYFLSPYKDFHLCREWLGEYWKYIILYFMVLLAISDLRDLRLLFLGFAGAILIYQAYSWYDFLLGGSYVWQQGMKRMVGVWSEGIGAANYYGMISVYCLPFVLFWYEIAREKMTRVLALCCFVLTFLSVAFSGTRGALFTFLFFIVLNFIRMKNRRFIFIALMIFFVPLFSYHFFPSYLAQRYSTVIPFMEDEGYAIDPVADEIQKGSASARIIGIVDGIKLVSKRPVLGQGPGASAVARTLVNKSLAESDEFFQLHSLYGQILAETGLFGTTMFLLIIVICLSGASRIPSDESDGRLLAPYRNALVNFLLVLLFYGFASHTLFRYYWLFAFAACAAFVDILNNRERVDETARHCSAS